MAYVITGFQVLLVELAGVALITGALYLYWNVMTKEKK